MAVAIIGPKFYAWDSDTGKPLAFGKVYTYQAGTNTPKATFTTEGGETQNANPVILNGAGYADIFLNGSYKVVVKDADDVEVWTSDPVSDPSQLQKEWVRQRNITQVNTTTFTVDGELTDEYVNGVAVRVKQDSGFVIGTVASATYADGKTTVTLNFPGTETITASAVYAERALVSFQSLPKNLGDRTVFVGSITDLKDLSLEAGTNVYLTQEGRSGEFVVKSGTPPSDIHEGIYIVLNNGNYAQRIFFGDIFVDWFGAKSDGVSDDSSSISSAFNFGDSVRLSPGKTYFIGSESEVIVDGKKLQGPGTIRKSSDIPYGIILSGKNPIITGIEFVPEGASAQPNADVKISDGCVHPEIKDCYFNNKIETDGVLYSAIVCADETSITGTDFPYATNVKGMVVSGNSFTGYTRPIYILCSDNYNITENIFNGCNFDAIRIRETAGWGNISDNQFYDIGINPPPDSQTRDAIDVAFSGYKMTINNNVIKNVSRVGIDIKGTDASGDLDGYLSELLIVKGNIIDDCQYSGISISECGDGFIVEGNIVTGCNAVNSDGSGGVGDAGILIDRNTGLVSVKNNIVNYCYGRGISISVQGADTNVRGTIVSGNVCVNNTEAGIRIAAPRYGIVEGNISEMRSDLPNSDNQTLGLLIVPSGVFSNSLIVKGNILRNNTSAQLSSSGSVVDAIFAMGDNYQEGPNAYGEGSTTERWNGKPKRQFYGNGTPPVSSAGTFQRGDIIWDTDPSASGKIGIVCVTEGSPGSWKPFGVIDA